MPGLVLLLPLAAALAAPQDGPPPVTQIVIEANGQRGFAVSGDQSEPDCARFRLTAPQVAAFFAKAHVVDTEAYAHDLPMSPCHARGTARFAGLPASWQIDQAGRGHIALAAGEHGYFFCIACAGPYDPLDPLEHAEIRALLALPANK